MADDPILYRARAAAEQAAADAATLDNVRDRALRATANGLALLLTAGFVSVPLAVMTGIVS